jgi:peroxiredoxin
MALTPSNMLDLGTLAPNFSLPGTDGRIVTLDNFKESKAMLVIFMCNHCPYVKHIRAGLALLAKDLQKLCVGVAGINSNDVRNYPQDNLENMRRETEEAGYTFPYLMDETQETAKAYKAACTPDFFLFDQNRRLVYRGQMDDSRPGNGLPVTGRDIREAVECILNNKPVTPNQKPSIGCNIKWKAGNAPL